MKNFVKCSLFVFITTLTTSAFSQAYRVVAGLNLAKMHIEEDAESFSDEISWKPGLNLGAMAEFPISGVFSIETGLLATSKGFKLDVEESFQGETFKLESRLNLWYLESPVNAKVSFYAGNTKIYGTLGSYLGIGLTGKLKNKQTAFGETQTGEENIEWGGEEGLKRIDFGLTTGVGAEFGAVQIGLNFGLGLVNIAPKSESENGTKINNQVFGVSMAYKIAGE